MWAPPYRMMDRNKEKKTLCAYVSLACSLAFDLRLDRADGNEYPCRETNPAFAYSYPIKPKLSGPGRTYEERRAALACYAISVRYIYHPYSASDL
jgi:hypothetical protein